MIALVARIINVNIGIILANNDIVICILVMSGIMIIMLVSIVNAHNVMEYNTNSMLLYTILSVLTRL